MNFTLKPYTEFRATYYYQLEDLKNADSSAVITILTPFYNSGKYIHEVAKSVFGQSFQLFQWVIVNDGSTDANSLNELAKYRNKDTRITIVDLEKNKGLPGARNAGIEKAKGKCIFVMFSFLVVTIIISASPKKNLNFDHTRSPSS
jgi:cellulose synthase/poly-beta-1,6-N-acetylglucosamine synthase-like glycosyltransferase